MNSTARIDVEDCPCPLCGSRRKGQQLRVRDHEYASTPRQPFSLVQCSECGLHYLSPRPSPHEVSKIYPPDYANYHTDTAPDESKKASRWRVPSVREISNQRQLLRYRGILQSKARLDLGSAVRILDVGCGDGYSLNLIKQLMPRAVTVGVEFDPEAAARAARHHEVHVGRFEEVDLAGQFDLILSSHVIEHVADPLAFLRQIAKLLSPGGVVIIDTPNIETPLFRLFGKHWGGIHAPRHWALFSEGTIRLLADRADLRIQEVLFMPINVFWVWSMHSVLHDRAPRLADRFFHPQECVGRPSLYHTALIGLAEGGDRLLGLLDPRYGQMRVILRHPT